MTSYPTLRLLGLASVGALSALTALPGAAQSFADPDYFYGGLTVGQSRAAIAEQRIIDSRMPIGVTGTLVSRDEKATGYRVFGGYQFNRYFGLEAGYFNLGKFGMKANTVPAGTLDGQVRITGLNLDMVGTFPMSERFALIGRLGVQRTAADDDFVGTGAAASATSKPDSVYNHYKLGAGVQYAFSPSLLMRGEAERYRINDSVGHHGAVTMLSVSLVVPFGRTNGPPPRAAYSPPPPVAAPAPPPVVVVMAPPAPAPMPAPVVPRRVSFSAESLFGFDKAQLRPEGKAALDTFARELQGTQFSTVQVEGHTDRLGTPAYNQTLSMSRAESVKSYLVTSGQVDPAKLAAVGKGETMPVTKPEDCKGNRASPALIACLQPDRRVEIEVIGTR